jgi:hypothetical protein
LSVGAGDKLAIRDIERQQIFIATKKKSEIKSTKKKAITGVNMADKSEPSTQEDVGATVEEREAVLGDWDVEEEEKDVEEKAEEGSSVKKILAAPEESEPQFSSASSASASASSSSPSSSSSSPTTTALPTVMRGVMVGNI